MQTDARSLALSLTASLLYGHTSLNQMVVCTCYHCEAFLWAASQTTCMSLPCFDWICLFD